MNDTVPMQDHSIFQISDGDYFFFKHAITYIEVARQFHLHHHPYPEIYFFIKGTAKYIIEGATYNLDPYDIILVPPYKIHQPVPDIDTHFERYVLNIFPTFYNKMDCFEYESLFSNLSDFKYKIPGRIVRQTQFMHVLNDLQKYSDDFKNMEQPIVRCKLCELLHILNSIESFENYNTQNPVVQEIIDYIDQNYASITNLSELAENFNYSKNHLGHIFKVGTGITITRYIASKKIECVKNLYHNGKSLTLACIEAGFNDYGSFAYNYKKIFGVSPRKDLS